MMTAKTIELEFNNGQLCELHMTPALINQVVSAYGLAGPQDITPGHVKLYIVEGLKKALGDADERHAS